MFKDGKFYLYFCIKKEWFFRVFIICCVIWDGLIYFGFYIFKYWFKIILDFIK